MKIVHIELTMRLSDGGVVRAVLDLCAALSEHGHDVTLLTCVDDDVPEEWKRGEAGRPSVVRLERPGLGAGLFTQRQLRPAAEAIAPADALHLHGAWTPSNLQFARLARRAGVGYVVSPHGMLDEWTIAQKHWKKRLFLALGGRRMLERAAAVHCTARAELEQSRRWFSRGRGVVLPLLLDLGQFESLPGPDLARERWPAVAQEGAKVLFLSRLHPKKGVEVLLGAVSLLKGRGAPVRLLVAGSGEAGYEAELRRRAEGLGDSVQFLGFVSGPEKVSLLQAADVFALPSSQENFGYAMFEALAAGTPVVVSRHVDTWPELVESGGAVVVEREAEAVAGAIGSLLEDAGRRADMGRAGREWVLTHLNPNTMIAGYDELYRSAARGAG